MFCMFQEICKQSIHDFGPFCDLNIVIPESEIPKWFSHQSVGYIVYAKFTHPNKNVNLQVPSCSSNKLIGIAMCAVSCPNYYLSDFGFSLECRILISKHNCPHICVGFCPFFGSY